MHTVSVDVWVHLAAKNPEEMLSVDAQRKAKHVSLIIHYRC